MILYVPEHVLFLVGLLQQLLQMNIDPLKPSLSISLNLSLNGCHLGLASLGSLSVLTNVLQLHDCFLILQLFFSMLKVVYNPLGSLQLDEKSVYLRLLLLNSLPQL